MPRATQSVEYLHSPLSNCHNSCQCPLQDMMPHCEAEQPTHGLDGICSASHEAGEAYQRLSHSPQLLPCGGGGGGVRSRRMNRSVHLVSLSGRSIRGAYWAAYWGSIGRPFRRPIGGPIGGLLGGLLGAYWGDALVRVLRRESSALRAAHAEQHRNGRPARHWALSSHTQLSTGPRLSDRGIMGLADSRAQERVPFSGDHCPTPWTTLGNATATSTPRVTEFRPGHGPPLRGVLRLTHPSPPTSENPQEKNEIYQRGPKWEVGFRHKNYVLPLTPPPAPGIGHGRHEAVA